VLPSTICPVCSAPNAPDARFCGQCGTSLAPACTRCGAVLPAGVRFCPSCGQPVQPEAAPGTSGPERKLVTVLFADVVESTGLGERLDPERLKQVMDAYFEAMRREIEAEGGTVEKFIGDAVMAVFGVPAAHEDDPARALRAALRMRGALERLNGSLEETHGVTLAMRIGVNTGEVVAVTVPRPGEGMVTGDAVNVAARLEQSAETGQIVVAERTARAARGHRLRPLGALELKGKEEAVRAYELLEDAVIPAPGLREEDAAARGTPLVGRDRELALLHTVYQRIVAEGRPALVTVYGEAGVGKSRLVEEFVRRAGDAPDPPATVRGRCLPYGDGITYWPLAEILKGQAGVLDSDPPEVAVAKVREATGKLLTELDGPGPDRDATAEALAFTVGLRPADSVLATSDPRLVRSRALDAWRTFFSALARRRPAVAVIEDIHWADPAMLDLLEDLADRAQGPLLFVCPSRQDLTARRPGWGGGRWNFSALLLEPLSADEAEELVDLLLGAEELPDEVRFRILERAGGNPFFLEEIVRHLVEEREKVAAEEGWRASLDALDVEIPDTVQGVLAARMDTLRPAEKQVLQSAAVVGRVFWTGPVERLLAPPDIRGAGLESILSGLEDRGLVVARLASSMESEREYVFRHILTRDVAYESLPRRERAAAHAEVAAWIEERAGERTREFAELLAHHYGEAYRGAREDLRPDPGRLEALREGAFRYALLASEDARAKLVLEAAERHGETALAVAATPLERSRALAALGWAYSHASRGDLAWQCLKEAVDLQQALPDHDPAEVTALCASALEVATRLRGTMRQRLSVSEAERYLEIASAGVPKGDSEVRVRLLVAQSFWPYAFRDGPADERLLQQALTAGEEAAAMAARLERPDLVSAALDGVGTYYIAQGLYGHMAEVVGRRLELAERVADPMELADLYSMASWVDVHVGRYREALRAAEEGFASASSGTLLAALDALDFRAVAKFRLGDWDGMLADTRQIEELLGERMDNPPGYASDHLAARAFVMEARGDQGEANRLLERVRWLERAEERPSPGWALWSSRVLARRGDFDDAREALERPEVVAVGYGRDYLLEAWCTLVAEQEAWDLAGRVVDDARLHAGTAGLLALPLVADRLEGLAAAAAGDRERAAAGLRSAAEGFHGLGAAWEAAVTRMHLARVLAEGPEEGHAEARRRLEETIPVFDRLRSLRELVTSGALLQRMR
jgi:class 3 adenylate cyclase/tetratricopeptide (TPR) repeat protein